MRNHVFITASAWLSGSFHRSLLGFAILFLLVGCAATADEDDPTLGLSASEIYNDAKAEMENGQFETAINLYSKLTARYPYGIYAQHALLDMAYCYYKDYEPETAILTADRFIKLNPQHENVDYVYYLRGFAAYPMEESFLDRLFDQDRTERDPKSAKRAFDYFNELVSKYPESEYTRDASKRMVYLRNVLGKHEIHVARFYIKNQAYVAAVNRAKYVLENYQRTPSTADALAIMVEAYRAMEMHDLADDALRVLQKNYPEHKASKKLKS